MFRVLTLLLEAALLSGGWSFHLGDASSMQGDFTHGTEYFTYLAKAASAAHSHSPIMPEYDDSQWQRVSIPHDWAVDLPYSPKASHSHGYKCLGWRYPQNSVGWYRRHLSIPAAAQEGQPGRGEDSRWFVEFDGIYRDSQVFLNGYFLGGERSGYLSSVYELTPYLNPDSDDNLLAVRCDASLEEGWYYEGAGIYRNVRLRRTGPVAIDPLSVAVDSLGRATCELTAADGTPALADRGGRISVQSVLLDAGGNPVERPTRLWSPDDPYLYTVRLTVFLDGVPSDERTLAFGLRKAEFSREGGFLLNGEKFTLKGCNLHLDAAGVGTGVPDALWRYKLLQLKKYGFNAIRSSHNPASPAMLALCDSLGFLVIDECRPFGAAEEQLRQLENMIRRDRNHPCVILWSVGNEEWSAEWNVTGTRLSSRMTARAHSIDPTRPTTYGSSSGPAPQRGVDVFGFNYIVQNDIDGLLKEFPSRTGVGTEETSGAGTRGKYATCPEKGWMLSHNRNGVKDAEADTLLNVIARGWRYYKAHPELGGLFYWTGTDYRGEPNPMVWPATGSQYGVLDYCCYPKDEAFYLQSVWREEPILHLSPHWNHPVEEGRKVSVWAYTNCEKVSLRLNGRPAGVRKVEEDGFALWELPYAPGTLEAVGWKDGKRISTVLKTSGQASDISIEATTFGRELAVLDIKAVDREGNFVPDAAMALSVSPQDAVLLGWGNGDPGFKAVERPAAGSEGSLQIETFSGRAQILLRPAEGSSGACLVKFTSDGGWHKEQIIFAE